MSTADLSPVLRQRSTDVPVEGNQQVTVEPGEPWPSAYRGSEYSVVEMQKHGVVVEWNHRRNLRAITVVPDGLQDALHRYGKVGVKGRFKITASGEVLTKVHAENYQESDEAGIQHGYIPIYLGIVEGFDFQGFSNNPTPPDAGDDLRIWTGLTFTHGETWSVTTDNVIEWRYQDYAFESVFDHPELVQTYKALRPPGGRIYINEHGHIWGNIDRGQVPERERHRIADAFADWEKTASTSEKHLVTQRLEATKSESDGDGLLPVHLGHLSQFDDGFVPKPVVTDKRYFEDSARDQD